jgi:hypothetical protein
MPGGEDPDAVAKLQGREGRFRDYYNDNAQRLDQAMEAFLTLLGSLLAHRQSMGHRRPCAPV